MRNFKGLEIEADQGSEGACVDTWEGDLGGAHTKCREGRGATAGCCRAPRARMPRCLCTVLTHTPPSTRSHVLSSVRNDILLYGVQSCWQTE